VNIALRIARHIICISRQGKAELPCWAERKSSIVYNPFDPALESAAIPEVRGYIRRSQGISENSAVVGFFGSLLKRKRPHILLDILRKLPNLSDGRPVVGLVCGGIIEPRDLAYFEGLADEALEARVIQAGFVSNPVEWMTACDVIIMPSLHEPFGRVAIEALQVERPLVVSDDSGVCDVLTDGESALFVGSKDPGGWVDAVRSSLEDQDLRHRLIEEGARVARRLDAASHARQVEAIYQTI
jgi:glycosyltransferase involved in cell wall biosynthesis